MPNKRRGGSGTVAERKTAAAGRGEHAGKVIPTDQLVSVLENLLAPATGLCWKATTRNRPISSRACWRKLIRKNSRPAYDYAQRRAQRASGPV